MRPSRLALLLAGLAFAAAGCTPPSENTAPSGSTPPAANTASAPGEGSSASGTLQIGMMPKGKGIAYFNACQQGGEEAAKQLGDVNLVFDGPTEDKSEAQSTLLDTWVMRKFDAVAVACNDPDQIASSLAKARDAGIATITYDADANPQTSRRQFFVNQADPEEIGKTLVDEMAKQAGAGSKVAIVSSQSTAPNQASWVKAMTQYMKQKYPGMTIVTTEYAGENTKTSLEKAQSIMKAYPEVKGIWGLSSKAFPGAAQAVDQAGKKGQVAVVGLGLPSEMKEFVDRDVVRSVILWDPVELGYLTVYVAHAVARGELKPGATSIKAGRLGEKQVKGDVVLLGKPMIFTKENIGKFNF